MANTVSIKNLKDLAESHKFDTEPVKTKKVGSKKVKVADWTLNSRHLLIHLFYNVLGNKPSKKDDTKLPSIDEENLVKMNSPLAQKLIKYRKTQRILDSLQNASQFVKNGDEFPKDSIPSLYKAVMQFSPSTYDNVERIFTVAEGSIPINADKRVRNALTVPSETIDESQILSPSSLSILKQLEKTCNKSE